MHCLQEAEQRGRSFRLIRIATVTVTGIGCFSGEKSVVVCFFHRLSVVFLRFIQLIVRGKHSYLFAPEKAGNAVLRNAHGMEEK